MEQIQWMAQESLPGESPVIMAEYILNELGIFAKRERRVSKKPLLNKVAGFRVGYQKVEGSNYFAAPMDRNAILWKKITSVNEEDGQIFIKGNQKDEIALHYGQEMRADIVRFINKMRKKHPVERKEDIDAAIWMCWRDDDDWGDYFMPLADMIEGEKDIDRFIDPDILAETMLRIMPKEAVELPVEEESFKEKTKFCSDCGASLRPDSKFCEDCGAKVD